MKAFQEATSSGLDVQLKILQALPFFLQHYGNDIEGELLASVITICTTLQASKNGIVNNTAAATLQQLVVTVFDKVVEEDRNASTIPMIAETPQDEGSGSIQLRPAAYDAYRVFSDLCLLTEAQRPSFLRVASIPQTFGLELIESVLTNHPDIFLKHEEQCNNLEIRLMPFVINSMSEKLSFATTVRVARILYTLLKNHLEILSSAGEVALGLLTHILDHDNTLWRRALCMEVFRGIFGEAALVRQIYSLYDAREGRKKVLGDLVAAFVRLSSEKPSVIGLGSQSTMPSANPYQNEDDSANMAMLEAGGLGVISSPAANQEHNAGISVEWSSMRVPCIDQLDKADAPAIPESYIYGLTLTCINGFSEGLAKFILPLTAPQGKRKGGKSSVPVNPLLLEDHPLHAEVKICEQIVDSCWPAIMATCSTFLSACLDQEYFHGLVRSFQKFTHVAGLLRLSTPRDAFLTTLGKSAVPPHVFTASAVPPSQPPTPSHEGHGIFSNAKGLLSVDSLASSHSGLIEKPKQHPHEMAPTSLNTRNLLALRALLNLGIALGPTLDTAAWLIILETLQQADFVIFSSSKVAGKLPMSPGLKHEANTKPDSSMLLANFGGEVKLVEVAASRLFESTVHFPDLSFVDIMRALCTLFGKEDEAIANVTSPTEKRPGSPTAMRKGSYMHRRVSSISASSTSPSHGDFFALSKLGTITKINIERLAQHDPNQSGWEVLVEELVDATTAVAVPPKVRQRASEVLVRVVLDAGSYSLSLSDEARVPIQKRLFETLRQAIHPLEESSRRLSISTSPTDTEVHYIILEAMKDMVEHCGENLVEGWDIAFDIIRSVFVQTPQPNSTTCEKTRVRSRSARLVRSAFGSLDLICSDFLTSLPDSKCFLTLVDTLYQFCTQDDDLNISLTVSICNPCCLNHLANLQQTVTFFWVVSDFMSKQDESFRLDENTITSTDDKELVAKATSKEDSVSHAALWLILLLRLTAVTTDERLELRNSAIHTLLRIFDANGDRLSPEAWSMCFNSVIFKMLLSVASQLKTTTNLEDRKGWIETTIVVLGGVSTLLGSYLHVLGSHKTFPFCWRALLDNFETLIGYNQLEINRAVFDALRQILAQANTDSPTCAKLDAEAVDLVWQLWSRRLPIVSEAEENNQDCLLAYISCFKELYRLMKVSIDHDKTTEITELLTKAVAEADIGSYSVDVEYLTPLQSEVLESLKMLRTDIEGVPSDLIYTAAALTKFPFAKNAQHVTGYKQSQTYVALSKASMTLLESLIANHAASLDVYDAVIEALKSVAAPMTLKYCFTIQTRSAHLWQHATTSAINIIRSILPKLSHMDAPEIITQQIWAAIVVISNGIITADTSFRTIPVSSKAPVPISNPLPETGVAKPNSIHEEENFDIEFFKELRDLIIPALGNPVIPDATRRVFSNELFQVSIVHAPHPFSLPQEGEDLLARLYTPIRGRTYDPKPAVREKMAYIALEQLADMVSFHDGSEERIKLARAAAPYLILRAGLTIKAYNADAPLRGLRPLPGSRRKELVFVLITLKKMKSEAGGIPDAPSLESEGRKHLIRLYPLLVKCLAAAAGDNEVLILVQECLEIVGGEFGI